MAENIIRAALLLSALFVTVAADAEIIQVAGNRVEIRLNGKKVTVGEQLDALDTKGARAGLLKVTGLDAAGAAAELQDGSVAVGMKVARHARVLVESARKYASPYTYDARVNPIGLIAGSINANFDFKVTEDWTIGLQGAYLHLNLSPSGIFTSNYNITAWGIGVRANYFFKGAYKNGFYFGPSAEYLVVNVKTTDAVGPASGNAAGLMAAGLIGYGWFEHGFNFMVGLGYGTVLGASGITIKDSVGNSQTIVANLSGLTYELSIGYAF